MAHKALIGGTAYNITGGKSLISGTSYNIAKGKTLVRGSEYDINFGPIKTAMLYSDGNFVFQYGCDVAPGKTLVASYTGFEDTTTPPWNKKQGSFTDVSFDIEVAPVSMSNWFYNARNMTTNIDNFSNLNMDNLTNMAYAYGYCYNLTGSPVCGDNVTNMTHTYMNCRNLTGTPVCGNNVTNMAGTYRSCRNLTGSPACGDNVTNMAWVYYYCNGLTGAFVCGNNVTNMAYAYFACDNLTGTPVCGNNVTNMAYTYCLCNKLTGSPVCGNNVTNMANAYYFCRNLTGVPVCGNNVTDMTYAYGYCRNLTGAPVCGDNVTNMDNAYCYCVNLWGNAYFLSPNVANVANCFYGRNVRKRLNIYVQAGSTTNTVVHYNNTFSLTGANITWTNAGSYQYNTASNIYIYPVANVISIGIQKGDLK